MRIGWGQEMADCRFELPPRFAVADRRLAGRAVAAWRAAGGAAVAGFDADSLVLAAGGDGPVVTRCGPAVAMAFDIDCGALLADRPVSGPGLAATLRAACAAGLADRQPVPIEARLPGAAGATILVRGVALPLAGTDAVQIVLSWREGLGRAATARLRAEIGMISSETPGKTARSDPFSAECAG